MTHFLNESPCLAPLTGAGRLLWEPPGAGSVNHAKKIAPSQKIVRYFCQSNDKVGRVNIAKSLKFKKKKADKLYNP